MNKFDFLVLAILLIGMAYLANLHYPNGMKAAMDNDAIRVFAVILAVAAFAIFLPGYFLKVFSLYWNF